MIVLQLLIFILPGIFYSKLRGSGNAKDIKLNKLTAHKAWFVVSCFGVLIFGSTLINTGVFYIFGSGSQYSLYNTFLPLGGSSWTNLVYIVITFAVLPAVTEEYIFRGILLHEYQNYGIATWFQV